MPNLLSYRNHMIGLLLLMMGILSACAPEAPPIPTLVPTNTPAIATATTVIDPTIEATSTIAITQTPALPEAFSADPAQQAYFRIVHATPQIGSTDVYINQLNVASYMEYGQFTQATGIVAGTYEISLVPADGRLGDSTFFSQTITLAGEQQVIFLIGGTDDEPSLLTTEENTAALRTDESRITFINMMLDNRAVSLLNTDNTALTLNLAPQSTGNSITVASAFQTLGLAVDGIRFSENPLELRERNHYIIVATGAESTPESIRPIILDTQVNGIASLRTLGATQGDDEYDIYLGDQLLGLVGNSVDLGRIDVETATYDINIYAAGANRDDIAPLLTTQVTLNPGDLMSIALIGETNNLQLVTYRNDTSLTSTEEARMVFIHAVPEVGRLSLSANGLQQIELNYGQISAPLPFNAELTTFNWQNTTTDEDIVVEAVAYELEAGREYLYLVTGLSAGNPQIYSEFVGSEILLSNEETGESTIQTLAPTPEMRTVSLVETFRVEFRINDQPVGESIGYGESSGFQRITDGSVILSVVEPATGQLLARENVSIDAGQRYSAYVYGEAPRYTLMLVNDETMQNYSNLQARMRLVNLTSGASTTFGIATGQPSDPPITNPDEVAEPITRPEIIVTVEGEESSEVTTDVSTGQSASSNNNRRTLPLRSVNVLSNVASGEFSAPAGIAVGTGERNVYIVDNRMNMIAATTYRFDIMDGMQYDVITYELPSSSEVRMFILEYPD